MTDLTRFQRDFLANMNFQIQDHGHFIYCSNPDHEASGYLQFFRQPGKYMLVVADYTIPRDFELDFGTHDTQLRFGLVSDGVSQYQIDNKPIMNFLPAPYIAIEDHLSGHQKWRTGQHYQGIEFFVDCDYLSRTYEEHYAEVAEILRLIQNHAILYLPLKVIDILRTLKTMALDGSLSPLLLEAKMLECVSLIGNELLTVGHQAFYNPDNIGQVHVSSTRSFQLTSNDIAAIHKAREILAGDLVNPPTIGHLSKRVYINEQKLTTGFRELYHMTIGHYLKELRLSTAANLLASTDLPVDEISRHVGYSHPSNFGKAFKAKYKRTPSQYRKFGMRPTT